MTGGGGRKRIFTLSARSGGERDNQEDLRERGQNIINPIPAAWRGTGMAKGKKRASARIFYRSVEKKTRERKKGQESLRRRQSFVSSRRKRTGRYFWGRKTRADGSKRNTVTDLLGKEGGTDTPGSGEGQKVGWGELVLLRH